MKKTVLITVAMVVALTCIVVFFLFISLDTLVTMAVEKYGTEILKADVRLNQTDISASSGKGSLSGLRVSNPDGFETESALELDKVDVHIDMGTIAGNTVVIKEVNLLAPQVTYERGAQGSNLDALKRNITGGESSGSPQKGGADSKDTGGGGKKLIIENLYIREGKVSVSAVGLGGKKMSVGLPTVHLKDIGKDKGGASPEEVVKKILDAIGDITGNAVKTLGVDKAIEQVSGAAGDAAKEVLGKNAGEAQKALEKGAGEIGSAVSGLLGK